MLRRDTSGRSTGAGTSKNTSQTCDIRREPSRSSNSQATATSARGQKRKSNDEPPTEQGSEFLRKKHNFIKSSIRFDYQPDICKDYKETGFCGFGDSCKFLHDRSDYKHGWQLEQEWAKGQLKDEADDKYLITGSDDEDNKTGDQSGAEPECPVCEEPPKNPVETKCKHRFCEKCFDANCIETCFVCHKATGGVQNPVKTKPKTSARETEK